MAVASIPAEEQGKDCHPEPPVIVILSVAKNLLLPLSPEI